MTICGLQSIYIVCMISQDICRYCLKTFSFFLYFSCYDNAVEFITPLVSFLYSDHVHFHNKSSRGMGMGMGM